MGKQLARTFAQSLGEAGFGLVSGLARGIDTCVHEASLPTGTVAVLAGGIDQIYPPENEGLYAQILSQGVLLSEMPLGYRPQATLFPRRNRLISGLCRGLLVVEGARRSGSLITARYGVEQGRDVFAIPGSPLDPRCQGSNWLIQEGAFLAQLPEDILGFYQGRQGGMGGDASHESPPATASLPQQADITHTACQEIRQALSTAPTTVDTIAASLSLPTAFVRAALVEIEIAGYLERHSGDRVCLSASLKEQE
jgi:DNA processing protein